MILLDDILGDILDKIEQNRADMPDYRAFTIRQLE